MVRWLGWLIMIEHLNLILTDEICLGASLGQFFFFVVAVAELFHYVG